jgi:hypothetical protein
MGTSYTLYEDDGSCEVVIDEMSNKLDLSIFVANYGHNAVISTGSMEPRHLMLKLPYGMKLRQLLIGWKKKNSTKPFLSWRYTLYDPRKNSSGRTFLTCPLRVRARQRTGPRDVPRKDRLYRGRIPVLETKILTRTRKVQKGEK